MKKILQGQQIYNSNICLVFVTVLSCQLTAILEINIYSKYIILIASDLTYFRLNNSSIEWLALRDLLGVASPTSGLDWVTSHIDVCILSGAMLPYDLMLIYVELFQSIFGW